MTEEHRQEQLLQLLQRLGLPPLPNPQCLANIDEALCHSSAGLARNHEQLEFLGDAVLRLACAEFLHNHDAQLSVGDLSSLRAQLVSDRWLAELADQLQLEPLLLQGASAAGDGAGRATVLADCCEALIGGVYQAWGGPAGGISAVRQWLDPHWQRSYGELLKDPYRHNWKSALQEWSQAQLGVLPHYSSEEKDRSHGNPRRFRSWVTIKEQLQGEGWGPSRREAEQHAAQNALAQLKGVSLDPQ
jgi:ribonuclease-3